jgi:hypothetical protein
MSNVKGALNLKERPSEFREQRKFLERYNL